MSGGETSGTRVTVTGMSEGGADRAALAPLRAAVERAVQAYRPAGFSVREVVVMLEESAPPAGPLEPGPVYVDVYDSGYGHGI
jgi:hypothetical protein